QSMIAAIYRRQLKLPEAIDHLSVSLKGNPTAVIYWVELLALCGVNGDYETALRAAQTVYTLNSNLTGNLYRLRQVTGTLEKLPDSLKASRMWRYQPDLLLQQRDIGGLFHMMDTLQGENPEHAKQIVTYYQT